MAKKKTMNITLTAKDKKLLSVILLSMLVAVLLLLVLGSAKGLTFILLEAGLIQIRLNWFWLVPIIDYTPIILPILVAGLCISQLSFISDFLHRHPRMAKNTKITLKRLSILACVLISIGIPLFLILYAFRNSPLHFIELNGTAWVIGPFIACIPVSYFLVRKMKPIVNRIAAFIGLLLVLSAAVIYLTYIVSLLVAFSG